MSDAGRATDRAAVHAEIGIPARHERVWVTHAVTVGRIVYKVNRYYRDIVAGDVPGKRRPRDTSQEAWLQANRLIEGIDEAMIRKVQEGLAHSESEGQRRMRELHGGSAEDLEVFTAGLTLLARAAAGAAHRC